MAKLKVRKSGDAQGLQSKVSLTKRCENGFVFKANVATSALGEAKLGELENGSVSSKNGVVMSLDGAVSAGGRTFGVLNATAQNASGKNLGGKNASCKNGVASSNALNANSKSSNAALNALNAVRKNAGKLALGALSAAAVLPNAASAAYMTYWHSYAFKNEAPLKGSCSVYGTVFDDSTINLQLTSGHGPMAGRDGRGTLGMGAACRGNASVKDRMADWAFYLQENKNYGNGYTNNDYKNKGYKIHGEFITPETFQRYFVHYIVGLGNQTGAGIYKVRGGVPIINSGGPQFIYQHPDNQDLMTDQNYILYKNIHTDYINFNFLGNNERERGINNIAIFKNMSFNNDDWREEVNIMPFSTWSVSSGNTLNLSDVKAVSYFNVYGGYVNAAKFGEKWKFVKNRSDPDGYTLTQVPTNVSFEAVKNVVNLDGVDIQGGTGKIAAGMFIGEKLVYDYKRNLNRAIKFDEIDVTQNVLNIKNSQVYLDKLAGSYVSVAADLWSQPTRHTVIDGKVNAVSDHKKLGSISGAYLKINPFTTIDNETDAAFKIFQQYRKDQLWYDSPIRVTLKGEVNVNAKDARVGMLKGVELDVKGGNNYKNLTTQGYVKANLHNVTVSGIYGAFAGVEKAHGGLNVSGNVVNVTASNLSFSSGIPGGGTIAGAFVGNDFYSYGVFSTVKVQGNYTVNNNTVILNSDANLNLTNIWGGYLIRWGGGRIDDINTTSRFVDLTSGNRLVLNTTGGINANIVDHFEYYDFYLPTTLNNDSVMLRINNDLDLRNAKFGISAAGAIAAVEVMSESEAKNRGLIATLIQTSGYLKLNTTGTGQNITPYTTRLLSGSERYNYNLFANNSVNGGYKQLLVNITKSDASVVEPILPPVTNNTTTNTTEPIVPPVSNNTTTNTTTPTIPTTPDGAIPVGPKPNSVTTGANNTFAAGFGNLVVTNASSSDLYGGFSSNGAAFGNAVEVKVVEVNGSVTGGFGGGISGLNKVLIHADSTINGNVTGAHAAQEASRSEVSVTGSLINGEVIGALSQTSHATLTNTSVTNSRVSGNITGAKATLDASNNIVKVTNTSVIGTVIGGVGQKANLNIVSITNSNIYSAAARGNLTAKPVWADTAELDLSGVAVIGGLGSQEAKANIVSVINSTIYGDICAGASKQGGASSNMVMLSGSKVVGKWVNNCVVSFNESQELAANETQPTANLQNSNLVLANSLASAPSQTPTAKTFNTMIDTSKPSLITDGAGFASSTNELTFILKEGAQNTQSALVVEGEAADFGGKVANIELVGEFSALQKAGDAQTFNLASNVKNLEVQGLKQTLSFDKSVEVAASLNPYGVNQTANQTLSATARVTANVEQKILLQASLAGAVAALNSDGVTQQALREASGEGDIAVAALDAGKFEQDQAGVKSKTYAFSAGFGRNAESSFAGAFVTGGGSSYDTALSVGNSVMSAEGSATFIAAGLFGKFDFGANSATITAKAGVSKTKFDAYAQSGVSLKDFSLNRAFYALQASFERVIELGDSLSLSPFAAFSLALIESKSVAISGLDYDFEAITSAKASIGARVETALKLGEGELKTSLTAAYEEEFSGEADAINANLGNPYSLKSLFGAPSLKGGSGTLSLSADYKPKGEGGFVVGVKLKGSVGENKGVGGSLSVGYKF